jgi:hypothetical protein
LRRSVRSEEDVEGAMLEGQRLEGNVVLEGAVLEGSVLGVTRDEKSVRMSGWSNEVGLLEEAILTYSI